MEPPGSDTFIWLGKALVIIAGVFLLIFLAVKFKNFVRYVIFGLIVYAESAFKVQLIYAFFGTIMSAVIISTLLTVNVSLGKYPTELFGYQCIAFIAISLMSPLFPLLCLGTLFRVIESKVFTFYVISLLVIPALSDINTIFEKNVEKNSEYMTAMVKNLRKTQDAHSEIGSRLHESQRAIIEAEGRLIENTLLRDTAYAAAVEWSTREKHNVDSISDVCTPFIDGIYTSCRSGFDDAKDFVVDNYEGINSHVGRITTNIGKRVVCRDIKKTATEKDPCNKYKENREKLLAFALKKEQSDAAKENDASESMFQFEIKGKAVLKTYTEGFEDIHKIYRNSFRLFLKIMYVVNEIISFFCEYQLLIILIGTSHTVIQFKTDKSYRNIRISRLVKKLYEDIYKTPFSQKPLIMEYIKIRYLFDVSAILAVVFYLLNLLLDNAIGEKNYAKVESHDSIIVYIFAIHLLFLTLGKEFLGNLDIIFLESLDEAMRRERARFQVEQLALETSSIKRKDFLLFLKCSSCERRVTKHRWCPDKCCRRLLCQYCVCH
ncbi:uncharacterized protein [Palaemon carinicauda]|uniref:uncharacterized protein isoform X2 n=1 Tax=Palaemon carinicauda TaxID=392227 RepID=UPI0035B64B00